MKTVTFLLTLAFATTSILATVKPAALFGDHMVLQQDMPVPVWGWADPGEHVTVTILGQSQSAVADADGKWIVRLDKLASGEPTEMVIAGKSNSVTFTDVLIGEVWLGSGQSNMQFTVSKSVEHFAGVNNEAAEIAAADYPAIRMFTVKMSLAQTPQKDCVGQWEVCSPKTVGAFSAVGYFFSRDLQKAIHRPTGFINSSFGASVAQAWISEDDLKADPRFKSLLDDLERQRAAFANASTQPTARGKKGPANPLSNHSPFMLWNAMLHPVQPYAIRGAVWYQGESIIGGTEMYAQLMQTLITSWRRQWGEGDFPFYFVQLAALDNNSNKPEVREAQAKALSLPNTAMAVTIDIGDKTNVHPRNKQDVGDRLARIARALVYKQDIEYSGPVFESMKIYGETIELNFTHARSGLMIKGGPLRGMTIAGDDMKFYPAKAMIDNGGTSLLVSAPEVKAPKFVRYAWERWPEGCNLYNADGLPAVPFRSDR